MYNSGGDTFHVALSVYIMHRHQRNMLLLVLAYLVYCRDLEDASASDTDSWETVSESLQLPSYLFRSRGGPFER